MVSTAGPVIIHSNNRLAQGAQLSYIVLMVSTAGPVIIHSNNRLAQWAQLSYIVRIG